jgi:peptide/nickel transport system substrate-binding protein
MIQSLKANEVDIVTEISPTIWDSLKDAENVKAVSLPSFSFHHIGINVSDNPESRGHPFLRDKAVRQALGYALDRRQLVEVALAGRGAPGDSIIPIGMTDWYCPIPESEQINGNIEKAKEILETAGYVDKSGNGVREKDGKPLEFRIFAIESTPVDVRAAQLFRDSAADAGVKLTLSTMDENTLGGTVYDADAPDWDIFIWGWDSDYPDPNYLLGVPLTSQIGNNNDVFYSNSEYDELYAKQSVERDPAVRKEISDRMQKIFYDDCAYLVMWYQDKLQAYREDTWTGWKEIPGGVIFNMTYDNYLNIEPAK